MEDLARLLSSKSSVSIPKDSSSKKSSGTLTAQREQSSQLGSQVEIHKWMVEVAVYPNGRVFTKTYPIGTAMRERKQSKKKKVQLKLDNVMEEEVY